MSQDFKDIKDGRVQAIEHKDTIHPRTVKGLFRTFKTAVMVSAYAIFFLLPWLRWERPIGSQQAVHFDLVGKKFYIFDLVVHAQDIFWLSALLFLAAVLLFFATALVGRVFCGFFCFQTLWTDAFRSIEKAIQGDRVKRIRLDKEAWDFEKIWKKGLTHFFWLLMAFWTGITFSLYWADAPTLFKDFFSGNANSAAYITTATLMVTTYLAAGWIKEYVCMHICPYARFQSVMYDRDTLATSYDYTRGESSCGRVKPIKELKELDVRQEKGHGDCVDCGMCVQVCPTGIDIRDGAQLSCINCGLCIDACDSIMDKFGWAKGLIRFASENELEGGKTHFFKLRTYGYGVAVIGSVLFLLWSISGNKLVDATSYQVRSPLYVTMSDGRIQNSYEIKINNKSLLPAEFKLSVTGLDDVELSTGEIKQLKVSADNSMKFLVKLRHEPKAGEDKATVIQFAIEPVDAEFKDTITIPSQFIIP